MATEAHTIQVTVQLVEGDSKTFKVSLEELVGALRQRAMAELGVQPAPGATYALFLVNKSLDNSVTLDAAGIADGTVLILATEPQVGEESVS